MRSSPAAPRSRPESHQLSTLVFLHAHPDDESISTGGTIARAVAEGHRVVLVVGTHGDHGETPADLAPGETLVDRRRVETEKSCAVLGVHRLVWLGYSDSGMTGWEQNAHEGAFMNADLDEASDRLVAVLDEENADVLVGYDWHGGYGHPDHVMVHRVVHAAVRKRPRTVLWEATMNRDRVRQRMQSALEAGMLKEEDMWDVDGPADDGNPFGSLENEISLMVDVRSYAARKRESVRCHASQVTDSSFFLNMPDDQFAESFGWEWFIRPGDPAPMREGFIV